VDYLFLHGGKQGGWVWDETRAALAAQAPGEVGLSLALDVPGCGVKRGRETAGLSFDALIADLAQDIGASGARDALLVGHSQAGTVMPRLIEALPAGTVRRAVYVACCAPAPGQTVSQMMGRAPRGTDLETVGWPADPAEGLDKLFAAMFCNDMDAAGRDAFLARLGGDDWPAVAAAETTWRYGRTPHVPATYVVCLDDNALPATWQRRFAERLGVEATVEVQAGHQAMNTRPQTLAEVLRYEARR
jgi:hypothetical protein